MSTTTGKAARRQFGTRYAAKSSKSKGGRRRERKHFGTSTRDAVAAYGDLTPGQVKAKLDREQFGRVLPETAAPWQE